MRDMMDPFLKVDLNHAADMRVDQQLGCVVGVGIDVVALLVVLHGECFPGPSAFG